MHPTRVAISAMVLVTALSIIGLPAYAAPFDGQPKIALHWTSVQSKNPCLAGGITDCSDAVTEAGLNSIGYAYVLIAPGKLGEVASAGFEIEYQDNCPDNLQDGSRIDIFGWNSCAGAQIASTLPLWPAPRSGIFLSWAGVPGCQTAPMTVGGYFYMSAYQADTLNVVRDEASFYRAGLVSCPGVEIPLAGDDLGSLVFSSGASSPGCNPCDGPCASPPASPEPAGCTPPPPPPPPPPPGSDSPKLLLHVGNVVSKNPCGAPRLEECGDAVTAAGLDTPAGPFHYLYLVAARGNLKDLAGIMVGVDYQTGAASEVADGQGVDVFSWTLCATIEFIRATPNRWPAPGGSNIIIWDAVDRCQTGQTAIGGYFYLGAYSPDRFRLINDALVDKAQVAECTSTVYDLERKDLGFVEFSEGAKARGCNPCLVDCTSPVTVTPATWSRIKTLIGR